MKILEDMEKLVKATEKLNLTDLEEKRKRKAEKELKSR